MEEVSMEEVLGKGRRGAVATTTEEVIEHSKRVIAAERLTNWFQDPRCYKARVVL